MAILSDILRIVVAWIDGVSIIIIRKLYELILTLSNLILTSDNVIKILGQRIGLILGIFMLFRIAITLINYLISPDKASDSSKGGGKLITSILVSLVLLASVNYIFNAAYKLQIAVVNSNIIEKIFFGSAGTTNSSNSNKINSDIDISYYLYSSFFTPNNDISELSVCDKIWDLSTEFVGQDCDKVLQDLIETNARESIINARNNMDMSQVYFNYSLVLAMKNANHNVFDYIPVLSTAIGVMAILILIGFCMDLATRAVKMLFLQIVAPIPIIYNMDPGKGKDVFQKWYKECFNTYLSVFLRLIAINFAVFMIALVYSEFSNVLNKNPLINALIIIGCLMFAKQVPKLLEDMLGIKMGGMVLNPIKKFQDQALFGKQIGSIAGGAIGGTIGGITAGGVGLITGQGIHGKTFTTAFRSGFKGESLFNNVKSSYSATKERHIQLQQMGLDGVSRTAVLEENLRGVFGLESRAAQVERLKNQGKSIQSAYDAIKGQMVACDSTDGNSATYNGQVYNRSAKTISKELDELKKTTIDKQSFRDQALAKVQQAVQQNPNMTSPQQTAMLEAEMDRLYDSAVTAQKNKIMQTEKELENRINAVVSELADPNSAFTTNVASADKVIREQTKVMNTLKKKSNELGKTLDSSYQEIIAADDDVVNIMKQGKAINAQASSGIMSDMSDVSKYTSKKK